VQTELSALIFWSALFALLYVPNSASAQYMQLASTLGALGARFTNFARYLQTFELEAEAWISSIVVDSTVRFTGTHAGLPRKLGAALDAIVLLGIGWVFLAFMSGAI
jgi:hypothetical protein